MNLDCSHLLTDWRAKLRKSQMKEARSSGKNPASLEGSAAWSWIVSLQTQVKVEAKKCEFRRSRLSLLPLVISVLSTVPGP